VGTAVLVAALHAAVLGFLMSSPEPQSKPVLLHVVAAELITSAPKAPAAPTPAPVSPPRPQQPPMHERKPAPPPVAHPAAPVQHERVAETHPQQTPAVAPATAPEPAQQSEASQTPPQAPTALNAATDDNAQHANAAQTTRAVAQLDCTIAKPAYPMLSRRSHESGTAVIELRVDVAGHIDSARVAASSGYPRLDAAALDAVRSSACVPYKENGKPVPASAKVPVVFNLSE
jgi:protein TonB